MKKIISINYNWYTVSDASYGEQFTNKTVGCVYGQETIKEINEHQSAGEGDRWYYDIVYESGKTERIFNPNQVFFE